MSVPVPVESYQVFACLLLAAAFLAFAASPAMSATGAVSFFGGWGTGGGEFREIEEIAINQEGTGGASVGDIYAVDYYNNRVQQFSSSGEFIRAFGKDVGGSGVDVCTEAAACTSASASAEAGGMSHPRGIAIDRATGNVFISDEGNRRVDVFSALGTFEGAFGWNVRAVGGAEELQFCTTGTGCKAGGSGTEPGEIINAGVVNASVGALAVSPLNGHLLLANSSNQRIDEFAPSMTGGAVTGVSFIRGYGWGVATGAAEFQVCTTTCHAPTPGGGLGQAPAAGGLGQFAPGSPRGIAIDSTGKIYATANWDNGEGGEKHRVETFAPAGQPIGDFAASAFPPDSGSPGSPLYGVAVDLEDDHVFVLQVGLGMPAEFDSAGNVLERYLSDVPNLSLSGIANLAVAETSGQIYLTDNQHRGVLTLGTIVPPTVSIEPVITFTGTTATFEGHINPHGLAANYEFEYSSDGRHWFSAGGGQVPSDSSDHAVSAEATGLEALTQYQVRLQATKLFAAGPAVAETTFETTTAPPLASATTASVSDTSARLEGLVNSENQETNYRFQCVSEAEFESSGYASAVEVPPGGETVGPAGTDSKVSQPLLGLVPGTGYRCRLVAGNPTGSAVGPDFKFITYASSAVELPDGRAYEQASPVGKNGSDVRGQATLTKASPDGNAVTFYSIGGTGGGEGGQQFASYVAMRRGGEWATHGLLPASTFGERAQIAGWSEDLTRDYALLWDSGTKATLFMRENESGSMREIAPGLEPYTGALKAGESSDGSRVLFESKAALTPEAKEGVSNLYVWEEETGTFSLVSVLPDGSTAPGGAFAGPYDWANGRPKVGGAGAHYYTQDLHAYSSDGTKVFFTTPNVNQLYVRSGIGGPSPETVQVSATQKTNGTDPKGPKKAAFMEATPDGRYVFFTSSEELTDDATTGSADQGNDLYRFDTESGQLVDLAPDTADANGAEVQGLLGSSADGSYAYFAARGMLTQDATAGCCDIYLWHDGTISFVGQLAAKVDADAANWRTTDEIPGNRVGEKPSRVSANGTLTFMSVQQETPYDNEGKAELYRYSSSEGIACVSCNPTGASPVGSASLQGMTPGFVSVAGPNAFLTHYLSTNGGRVFFETPDKLIASDTNGDNGCPAVDGTDEVRSCQDVYEWEADGTGTCNGKGQNGGCLYLISTGESPEPSYIADAGENGDDIFFFTRQSLVRQDTDQLLDVYDARIGGGIAAQNDVPPAPCEGESCRESGAPPPAFRSAGSASFSGPPNPVPSHKKAKKKKRHNRKHHKKTAREKAKGKAKSRSHR